MTAFIIRAITEKPITVIENGNEILAELKRQGNNLNQAVRGIYNGLATVEEIQSAKSFPSNLGKLKIPVDFYMKNTLRCRFFRTSGRSLL